jgi:muramoyltetrapeptide carboxypeptidase
MPETADKQFFPPFLVPGDAIGVITPAGPVTDKDSALAGINLIEKHGYKVRVPNNLEQQDYLAGTDEERAKQFIDIWNDNEIKAVLAIRGGYGALRLLPYLDLKELAEKPKILAGFSDITILLNEITRLTGLITFHSPMLATLSRSDQQSQNSFFRMLAGNFDPVNLKTGPILTGGTARGRLIGGNLASLIHLLGTPHEPDWLNNILLLEDVGEAPYKIDRMLTQLQLSGRLEQLAGIIIGTFTGADDREEEWSEVLWERAQELSCGKIPLWGNLPVGHGARNITLPIGMEVVMNSDRGRLEFIAP